MIHSPTRSITAPTRTGSPARRAPRDASRTHRLLAAGLLVACATGLPPVAYAACQIETEELPIRMVGSRATATLRINDAPVPMMVDSGAFFSFLTDAAASQLDLATKRNGMRIQGVTGRVDARMTTVDRLQLFKGVIEHVDFVVGGNDPGAGTMGIIGRNILAFADAEYDLGNGVIRLVHPTADCAKANMAYWAGSTPVTELELETELRAKTPAIRAKIKLNGTELMALFDTGATSTVVTAQAARRAGVPETEWKRAGTVTGGGRGRADAYTAPFEQIQIGGETIRNDRLGVANVDLGREADLLVGIDFFLSHRIYVSKQQSRIFITYNGGPVFAQAGREPVSTAAAGAAKTDAMTSDAGPAPTADELARRGAASAARRDYESALADLDRACAMAPTSAALFAQRGTIQEGLKHPEQAREDYDKALTLDPTAVDARFRRIGLRLVARDRDGARTDLDELDRTLAPQAQMRLPMSQLYLALEQPAKAIVQLNQWLPAHRNEVQRDVAFNNRCRARLLLGTELDQALDDCDEAIDVNGGNPGYLDNRGWVELRLGKDRKAIADFDRSLAVRPKNAAALYGRGVAKTRLGDTEGEVDLKAARAMQPDIEARLVKTGVLVAALAHP